MIALVAGGLVTTTVLLVLRPAAVLTPRPAAPSPVRPAVGWARRGRLLWVMVAVVAGPVLWPGGGGLVLGVVAGLVVGRLVSGSESPEARRERDGVRRDLPVLVLLLATALRGGSSAQGALRQVCLALPGPGADRLGGVGDQLALGVDPVRVWERLADDPELAPLGRALARAQRTGSPVATVVERLADELAATARAEVEDRARAVGVRAAVPLGVCLLPAFLLLGIVPLVATLLSGLGL